MCGIAGIFDSHQTRSLAARKELVSNMSTQLTHRGPDAMGAWVDIDAGISLAHRRLSILDLSETGKQPMHSESGRYVLSFNGEIYNFPELKNELLGLGHSFRGTSDTETMLVSFEEWGVQNSLAKFSGMFAFALWDAKERCLFLARDRLGQKPLYYGRVGTELIFGSELKALEIFPGFTSEIDPEAIALFMRYNYIPAPYSIYRGVRKLLAGHFLKISSADIGGLGKSEPFWSLEEALPNFRARISAMSQQDTIDQLEKVLGKAVRSHLISDVPIGAFLSGGVDSSTIVSLMTEQSKSKVKTFTIGFDDDKYNEAKYAQAIAGHLKTEHHELYLRDEDARDVIPSLPHIYDEPFADSSQIPTYLISKLAREHVTVSLSGDGGDEVFAGYNRYIYSQKIWNSEKRVPLSIRKVAATTLRAVPTSWLDFALKNAARSKVTSGQIQKLATVLDFKSEGDLYLKLVSQNQNPHSVLLNSEEPLTYARDPGLWPTTRDKVSLQQFLDAKTYLPDDILTKVDRASMSVGLEVRVPFLDPEVLSFGWNLSPEFRIRNDSGKWLLKQLLFRRVPRGLIERPKKGFAVPIGDWLRGSLRPWAEDLLDEKKIAAGGIFNPTEVARLWNEHLSKKRSRETELWSILMFQAWFISKRSLHATNAQTS